MAEPTHTHQLATKQTKVLLHSYYNEDGETKVGDTRGYDLLTVRYCTDCPFQEATDLTRTILS